MAKIAGRTAAKGVGSVGVDGEYAAYAGKLAIDTVNASSGSGRRRIAAVKYGEAAAGTYKE